MRVRYCETILQKWFPCDVDYTSYSKDGSLSCYDNPMEENCRNIVDNDTLRCPICGGKIK